MNRIYQGRVSKVEVVDGKDWKPFDPDPKLATAKWQAALWQHHELFQDAVNYYTLALAAMATEVEGDSAQAKALRSWVSKVRETWQSASRRAQVFDGPQKRLVPVLKLESNAIDFEAASKQVLRTSHATPVQRAAALMQLLEQKGDLNTIAGDRLPWLSTASGKLDATSKAITSSQEKKRQATARQFQQWEDAAAIANAASLDLGLFVTTPPTESAEGEQAARMLRKYFEEASKKHSELQSIYEEFEQFIKSHTNLKAPLLGRKPSGIYPIATVFKLFPRQETLFAFRQATKSLAEGKDRDVVLDALADARVDDQPQFDYFTNLVFTTGDKDERDTRAVWFDFDLAAFIEAIKAPRRYFDDTQKRESAAQRIRQKIAAMEGKGREASGADDEDESLPGFEDDVRIDLLKDIVQKKLAWLAEAEDGAGATDSKEYTIRVRTIRGFGDIKRRWRVLADTSKATEAKLLEILAEEQAKHRDDFGSATFYQELAKPALHPIWRDAGTQPWHAEDPLAAWLDYKDLQAELQDKERPIRFTPAHAKHSPRFFIFPKESEAKPKKLSKKPQKSGLKSRHGAGQTQFGKLSFTAGIILKTERGVAPTVVKIQYAAPRLCRDGIRSSGDSNLYAVPWLQPMMAALGVNESPDQVNFANCRITLQPNNEMDFQLTFPVEVNTDKLIAGLGKEKLWNRQFNLHPDGDSFYNASLRWPHEKQPAKPPEPWFVQVNAFHTLATDLGQRDAGAFARMVASWDDVGTKPSRYIGTTNEKKWQATLERSGLFRLPGEDTPVWRKINDYDRSNPKDSGRPFDLREELFGEHGRLARDWEADDTADLMLQLEVPSDEPDISLLPDNWRAGISFPEQNGKLLIALRRYQSRIARLHRWCWFLKGDIKQQETVWEEVAECDDARLVSAEQKFQASKRDPRLGPKLESQLQGRLHLVPTLLERIANRILPLRGRSWRWGEHPDAAEQNRLHVLTQAGPSLDSKEKPVWLRGQRGLSLERIEQVEELRKRCQSLNQTMRRPIGSKPPTRRDESVPDPCPDLLEKLDNLKKQRINQTAHLILAEALGLRLAIPPLDKKKLREEKDQHGVYEKILDKQGQWIGPVDFIVIEDLSRYRASQGRAPRENSRLMKWCHRAVRDKLKQLCEIFGLPVLEAPAAYSSRFCSRSGVPGFRAQEVVAGFTKTGHWAWLAGKKDEQGRLTLEAQRLRDLDAELSRAQVELEADWIKKQRPGQCPKRTLLVPVSGGSIFVPIVSEGGSEGLAPKVVQADINAAINLALRAIADPKVWTIHPRLRTQRDGEALGAREKRKFGEKNPPKLTIVAGEKPITDTAANPNFFADCAGLKRIADRLVEGDNSLEWLTKGWTAATLSSDKTTPIPLLHSKSLWGTVKNAQWQRIEEINQKRLNDWFQKMDQSQIP